MTSHALLTALWFVALAPACGVDAVEARAIWVDDRGGDGQRRIHIYDRGEQRHIDVLGDGGPIERVRLDPDGRGLLIRAGDRRGAWFDLDDGRRLPLLLPPSTIAGSAAVEFADEALVWIDALDGSLALVPLAAGLELARRDDGSIEPLVRAGGPAWSWFEPASDAPVVLAADVLGGRASLLGYPTRADQPLTITRIAEAEGLELPATPREFRTCESGLECYAQVSVDGRGELAMVALEPGGPWQVFDRGAPEAAGVLELPEILAEAQAGPGLRLLKVLDRAVSIWLGAGQLHRYDRAGGVVDSLPVFASPPLHWFAADHGRAVILLSTSGAVYRGDLDGLRLVSVESTECVPASAPVVAPRGGWAAWTCFDLDAEITAASGAVVRVSAAGLERYVGVPMATVAIDDDGDLLLYSTESIFTDEVDGVSPTNLPRNLFVLSNAGVLTRIDELEPAPGPVLLEDGDLAAYIQGVALAADP